MSRQGLTVAEAAQALGVSQRTVRRQIKSGKIKAMLVPGPFGPEYRISELGEVVATPAGIDKASPSAMDKAFDMIKALQQEKAELYAQVAYFQAQCRHLEDRVKLLVEAKRPWWRRWLGR
ncbi:MAG: helix-turn-helix domain-containing protein [Dehalococcoidia bacterium]|nr:MAG: helix-turn-helix domain-containing protein [Dehalococcoidia bacterium]